MDILKAANKVGTVAGQVAAAAVQQRQLENEQKVLADLRTTVLSLRAQIGEEIFKQWKAGKMPASPLDPLLEAVDTTTAAIARQRALVDQLLAGPRPRAGGQPAAPRATVVEEEPSLARYDDAIDEPGALIARTGSSHSSGMICPSCGEVDATGRPFCGYCGTRFA